MIENSAYALAAAYFLFFIRLPFSANGRRRSPEILVTWPFLLYLPGPLATLFVLDEYNNLRSYTDERAVFYCTLSMLLGLLAYKLLFSRSVSRRVVAELKELEDPPAFLLTDAVFYLLGTLCVIFQTLLVLRTGSWVVSGDYAMGTSAYIENSGLWGFTAGLYEAFAGLLALRVSIPSVRRPRFLLTAFSVFVLGIRALSGTRLVLIKLLAVVVLVRYVRGAISSAKILLIAIPILFATIAVGSFRMGDAVSAADFSFSVLGEPALASLSATVVTDYYLSNDVYVNSQWLFALFNNLSSDVLGLVPGFLYRALGGQFISGDFGVVRESIDQSSIFAEVQARLGLNTISPAGGLSLVAVGAAIFGPALSFCVFPLYYGLVQWLATRLSPRLPLLLIFSFESASLFRDGTQIFFKQLLTILGIYIFFGAIWTGWRRRRSPNYTARGG